MTPEIIITLVCMVALIWFFLALELVPFVSLLCDESAARLAPFRERLTRGTADLKSSVAQKARAGARLVALLWHLVFGGAAFLVCCAVVFVSMSLGYLLSPLVLIKELCWDPLVVGYEAGAERLVDTADQTIRGFTSALKDLRAGPSRG